MKTILFLIFILLPSICFSQNWVYVIPDITKIDGPTKDVEFRLVRISSDIVLLIGGVTYPDGTRQTTAAGGGADTNQVVFATGTVLLGSILGNFQNLNNISYAQIYTSTFSHIVSSGSIMYIPASGRFDIKGIGGSTAADIRFWGGAAYPRIDFDLNGSIVYLKYDGDDYLKFETTANISKLWFYAGGNNCKFEFNSGGAYLRMIGRPLIIGNGGTFSEISADGTFGVVGISEYLGPVFFDGGVSGPLTANTSDFVCNVGGVTFSDGTRQTTAVETRYLNIHAASFKTVASTQSYEFVNGQLQADSVADRFFVANVPLYDGDVVKGMTMFFRRVAEDDEIYVELKKIKLDDGTNSTIKQLQDVTSNTGYLNATDATINETLDTDAYAYYLFAKIAPDEDEDNIWLINVEIKFER